MEEKEQYISGESPNQPVELRLSAMANLTDSPSTVVLMLSPKTTEEDADPSGLIRHVFPIRLTRGEGAMYFRRLTAKLRQEESSESVEGAFMRHYGVMIDSVMIRVIRDRISAEIHVVDAQGSPLTYEDRVSGAVLLAFFCDAPIFVERFLIQEASKSLKMHFVDENGERLTPESGEQILQNVISSGSRPEEMPDGIKLLLANTTEEQRKHLKDFAIDRELYEWAGYLTRLRPDEAGQEATEEK